MSGSIHSISLAMTPSRSSGEPLCNPDSNNQRPTRQEPLRNKVIFELADVFVLNRMIAIVLGNEKLVNEQRPRVSARVNSLRRFHNP